MTGFFHTLIEPDHEEAGERSLVIQAANLLQVGEFQLLQLAYADWHGHDMPAALIDGMFSRYMFHDEVPIWARAYAHRILDMDRNGELDDSRPAFHRFDSDYFRAPPQGVRRFGLAVFWIVVALAGSLYVASLGGARHATSILPPFFDVESLPKD